MDRKKGLKILIATSIIAIVLFSYLLSAHYSDKESTFCNFGEGLNCDIVNKSIYSELFGIPVALFGILTFLLVLCLSILSWKDYNSEMFGLKINSESMMNTIFWASIAGVLFALYLVYIEAFVLYSFCILCFGGDILIIIPLATSYSLTRK